MPEKGIGGQSPPQLYPQDPATQPTVLLFGPGPVELRLAPYGLPDVPWGSWALFMSPRPPADPAHMLAVSQSNDLWLGVGFIAAITVMTCLAVIAATLRHELEFIRVVAGAKRLRDNLTQQIDEAEAQHGDQPNPATGRPGMIGSPSPMPASAESAETEAIIDSPPEPEPDAEPAVTGPAQAA